MSDVENNMDELFRRAAVEYPLKKSQDNWELIAPLLEDNTTAAVTVKKGKRPGKYSILLYSLILFLLIAGYIVNHSLNNKELPLATLAESERLGEEIKIKDKNKIISATVVPDEKIAGKKQLLNIKHSVVKPAQQDSDKRIRLSKKRRYSAIISGGVSGIKAIEKMLDNDLPPTNEKMIPEKISNENLTIELHDAQKYIARDFVINPSVFSIQQPGKKDVVNTSKEVSVNKNKKGKKQQEIYLGFLLGASFNQIKTQGLMKPGYDFGMIAGYQINQSLSLETGFMYDRKNYFTSGKYFDMSKLSASMPASMKLLSMEGSCAVFEIPVKIKYNLRSKGNSHFYSTAGVSSYIMTNENNKYRSVTNGTEQHITGNYSDNSRYFAAALDVSLGYESKMGSFGNIRIEPYLQIPLKGIGMGSLPVMTAGLHVGFTRAVRLQSSK